MTTIYNILSEFHLGATPRAVLLIIIGFFLARVVSGSIKKAFSKRLTMQQAMILNRGAFYLILALFIASAIQELGFSIGALLGATGILTVAIGIASQTSMSNVISGIFIIGEKPFEIGDTINVNNLQGEVIGIDFLSVKIRTSENMMVRIPNELLIKSPVTNISYFPIRRTELVLTVNFKADFEQIKKILLKIAEDNAVCLPDPSPSLLLTSINDAALNLQFCAWSKKENCNELKSSLLKEIKTAFTHYGIESPVPLHTWQTNGDPLPIKIISDNLNQG